MAMFGGLLGGAEKAMKGRKRKIDEALAKATGSKKKKQNVGKKNVKNTKKKQK